MVGVTQCLAINDETVVGRDIVFTQLLGGESCHRPNAVAHHDAVEATAVRVCESAQHALIRIDTTEEKSLLVVLAKVTVKRLLGRPHAARTIFIEKAILVFGYFQEWVVKAGIPASLPEAAALVIRQLGSEANVPAVAKSLCPVVAEATLDSWWHHFEVMLVDAPVEPCDLDAFLAASLDHIESWLDRCDSACVVTTFRVYEVVLHIDDDQDCFGWIDHDTLQSRVNKTVGSKWI